MMRRPSKFGNRKTVLDGITFDSASEARRYAELKLLQRAGVIQDLRLQVPFPLVVNGVKVASYIADFVYTNSETGQQVIEDRKGYRTPEYRLKAKIMAALGTPIKEVAA